MKSWNPLYYGRVLGYALGGSKIRFYAINSKLQAFTVTPTFKLSIERDRLTLVKTVINLCRIFPLFKPLLLQPGSCSLYSTIIRPATETTLNFQDDHVIKRICSGHFNEDTKRIYEILKKQHNRPRYLVR